jgi:hypothetical protein
MKSTEKQIVPQDILDKCEEYCKDIEDLDDGDEVHSITQVGDAYIQGAIDERNSGKEYTEADMLLCLKWCYETVSVDGLFGHNARFKEIYNHFWENKKTILKKQ